MLRLEVLRLHIDAEGPGWKHSEISHTAVRCLCVHSGAVFSACDSLKGVDVGVCMHYAYMCIMSIYLLYISVCVQSL